MLERRAIAQAHRPDEFQPWLLEDLQRLHRFSAAAGVALGLTAQRPPIAPALYPDVPAALVADLDPIYTEDLSAPLSIGTDELTPVTLHVGPSPGGASAQLSDLDFIPVYRPSPGLGGEGVAGVPSGRGESTSCSRGGRCRRCPGSPPRSTTSAAVSGAPPNSSQAPASWPR
ncbi:MAG: hypothetical protein JO262_12985 [Solirubrobacterales bacterium]|nr:hypothetical protein [Solirubrobacterales bacterium]